ncbi:YbhN family protein [Methyloferula stellata]|uniref:YbhN family protein n=1 Tax=Methyloferula stellata TaxID=876270 RepID=UPI0003765A94|nr:YbhN family protein [Methyloferula stellata]
MKRFLELFWPLVGLVAVAVSAWFLYREFRGESVGHQVWAELKALTLKQYALAILSTLVAYVALAWYDRIALLHLGVRHISWIFVGLCSFTTYALAHNIGASVVSGAMVRYRAYTSKGLSAAQIAVLVALCSLTFGLGTILLGGIVLIIEPERLRRLGGILPGLLTDPRSARIIGTIFLAAVAIYILGSVFRLKPLVIGGFRVEYPRPGITVRQLIAAPMELIGAAGIIYFALPEAGNPGFMVILAIFLASFSAALVSNAPGGLGVFELIFLKALPALPQVKVLTALLVFRLFYLLIPLAIAIVIVILFERRKLDEALHRKEGEGGESIACEGDAKAIAPENAGLL